MRLRPLHGHLDTRKQHDFVSYSALWVTLWDCSTRTKLLLPAAVWQHVDITECFTVMFMGHGRLQYGTEPS